MTITICYIIALICTSIYLNLSAADGQKFRPNKILKIEGHILKCGSISAGYKCTSESLDLHRNICRNHSGICPSKWGCIDLSNGFLCKSQIDVNFGQQFKRWLDRSASMETRKVVDNCEGCPSGTVCQNGKYRCLMHYMGRYCDQEIDYCLEDSCKKNIKCLPRLGGFTCDCPSHTAGKFCQLSVRQPVFNMEKPNFLYEPFQYTGFHYHYLFYTIKLGFQPEIEISFGDGIIKNQKRFSQRLIDAFDDLLQYFQSPVYLQSSKLQVYYFRHAYSTPNIYMINVKAWNHIYEVYNSNYEVQVSAVPNCTLELFVRNPVANNRSKPLYLYRENSISIVSSASSSCLHIKLKYQWTIHKLTSFEDDPTAKNLIDIGDMVELENSNLEIPSFTLDYGSYAAILFVEMLSPRPGIKREAATWFSIERKPIIAHIEGGKKIWVHTNALFRLNASMSYDPNFSKKKQPRMSFTWRCRPVSKFCKGDHPLDEKGPVLIVPPNALNGQKYRFSVWANSSDGAEVDNYAIATSVEVQRISKDIPTFTITCLRNCIGGFANSLEPIALRGSLFSTYNLVYKKSWVVYSISDTTEDRGIDLDNADYSKDNSHIIIYGQELEAGQAFKFVFSGYEVQVNSDVPEAKFAEFLLRTYGSPEAGQCSVSPTEGYGMLTVFSVSCTDFFPNGYTVNETLQYEVTQFSDLQNRLASGAFVGYDVSGTITNITLPPGTRLNDYVTTLRITATNSNGLWTFIECNVTVFPIIYYFTKPTQVLQRFVHLGGGPSSPLSLMLASGSYFELVQQIASASPTLLQFLENPDLMETINEDFLHTSLEEIHWNFMGHLFQVPLSNVKALKHLATALDQVMKLPLQSVAWRPGTVMGIYLLKKVVEQLEEKINTHEEKVSQEDLDDIGIILAHVASKILKTPTSDSRVLREDVSDPVHTLTRTSYIKQINPYAISSEILYNYDSNVAVNVLEQFMRLYVARKVPNERSTLISGPKLALLIKRAEPEFLTVKSLTVVDRVSVKLLFNRSLFEKKVLYDLGMVVMDDNPNWYYQNRPAGFRFPFVKIDLVNDIDGSKVNADLEIDMKPIRGSTIHLYNGSLPIVLFWQVAERHIQVHRIIVRKGGKLLIEFLPIKDNRKIKVVIKKNVRPKLSDFWYNSITIPQKTSQSSGYKDFSILVDDEITEDKIFYYMGVLPHIDTLKELMKHVEEPILPHMFHYGDEEDEYDYYEDDYDITVKRAVQEDKLPENSTVTQWLPYSFLVHSVYCVMWDESTKHWKPTCSVKATTTASQVICNCSGHALVTATFHKVSVQYRPYSELKYSLSYYDNPLITFVVVFTLVLFIGLFAWAAKEDGKDNLRQTVCFLVDNYPQCEYCYLVIVHTGRLIKAGTTSNVTIEIEGTNATSLPHVLKDWRHEIFGRGQQDWFVLKTLKPLGEIYCLHIWTDYSGSRPSWYCSKILIHDIQEQQIWFFNVEKWFDPIHGDGSMSYTIYQSTDSSIFSAPYHLTEGILREFDSGTHGWFSIFYKHPYNNYTRKERVAVGYMHLTVMMVILTALNDMPLADAPQHQLYKTSTYEWEVNDLVLAIYTVIIAFPIHNFFVWLFRCIKPSLQWTESIFDNNLSRFNLQSESDVTLVATTESNKFQVRDRKQTKKKSVAFSSDYYEPDSGHQLLSKFSLEELERHAGLEKVVPLRIPTSKVETEENTAESPPVDLNTPVYGREVVIQSYCFPPCFVYVTWILLFIVEIPCIYITVLYGISYGWIFSLHFLTSLFIAIFLSMFVVEPLKLLCWSFYLFVYNKREYAIEDRSDLVESLNSEFAIPTNMQNMVVQKINRLRELDMYSPLEETQLRTLKRNRVVSFLTKIVLADFMLLLLFVLLLSVMTHNMFDPFSHWQYRNIEDLITRSPISRRNALVDVQIQEDLVNYLEKTLIANLYCNDENRSELTPTVDGVNYIIGAIQLRQVRKMPSACRPRTKRWAARCINLYDVQNYTEGWSRATSTLPSLYPNITKGAWLYEDHIFRLKTFFLHYNESRFPSGSYKATLGRTKSECLMGLEYLAKKNWFNYLTKAVSIRFVLYNPHLHYLSFVRIIAERMDQGLYYMHSNIEVIKTNPHENNAQILVLILLLALFVWLIISVNKESRKYSLIPKQIFTKKWNRAKKFLSFLGIINVVIYIKTTLDLNHYHQEIAIAAHLKYYPEIEFAELWNRYLRIFIAFTFFLVILDLCQIFDMVYIVQRALTASFRATKWGVSFYIYAVILVAGFTWAGCVLFTTGSYSFQNIYYSFCTIIGAFPRYFKIGQLGNVDQIRCIACIYSIALVISFFFVFRWLMATIVIHSFSAVKRNARRGIQQPILSRYTKKYFDTVDSSPNRKPIKLMMYLYKIEYRTHALGFLFVDLYNEIKNNQLFNKQRKPRARAMDVIALDVIRSRHRSAQPGHDTPAEVFRRKEQAKAMTRTIIFVNTLKNKLDYLGAKIDKKMREERYNRLRKSKH